MTQPFSNSTFDFSEAKARDFYDRWIGGSGLVSLLGRLIFRLSGSMYARAFVQHAQLAASESVLELGCGFGSILMASQRQVQSREAYVGIDLSCEMISRARNRARRSRCPGRIEFILGSVVSLPLRERIFDVVLLSHTIKYLTDAQLRQVMSEARRVLKNGGRIVLWEFKPFISSWISEIIARKAGGQKLHNAAEIKKSLECAGFQDLTSFHIVTPWVPWKNLAFHGRASGKPIVL